MNLEIIGLNLIIYSMFELLKFDSILLFFKKFIYKKIILIYFLFKLINFIYIFLFKYFFL